MVRLATTSPPAEKHQQHQHNSTNNDTSAAAATTNVDAAVVSTNSSATTTTISSTTTTATAAAAHIDTMTSATVVSNLTTTPKNASAGAEAATTNAASVTPSPTTVNGGHAASNGISQPTAANGGSSTSSTSNIPHRNTTNTNSNGNITVATPEGSLTPSTPSPQLPAQIILTTIPHQHPPQQPPQQSNASNPPPGQVLIPTPHPAHTIQVMTNPSQGLPPQPPCAIHQTPQQQQQQMAALQAHLAAIAHQQHHHSHMGGPPPQQQQQAGQHTPQQQQQQQPHPHMPQHSIAHTHPSHHHYHHHGPPHGGPQQQPPQQGGHIHENGHVVVGGGQNNSMNITNLSNNGSGNASGGSGSSPINGPNQSGAAGGSVPAPQPPPGGIYIPYTGEFYPTEHGYFIPHHPHDICPAHPTICSMPSEYGPTTVQMVSQNRPPPIPVPVQVPQGQVMQQYNVNDGTLTHVVLSPSQYQQLQQLHAGQGGVPHLHHQYITNGTTSHATYYSPIPTGFPGPGGGPHYHPIQSGLLQPQQMSHSPSPPNNYHNKDDRTQRQHAKLLRKLNNREMNSAMSTPAHSPSPRKELNGRRISRNGASSVGTSEDGEESSSVPDDEDDCQTIIEQLSAVQKPEVTDVTSRTAMLRWEAPPLSDAILNSRDLRYDVLLSDRGKEGKYKLIFKGESYVCMIQDLRPGQEYHCRLQVHYEKLQGTVSEPTAFTTPPCEPDQPSPPKLIARSKNSLQLRWQAPFDNGSHISQYILEVDDCKGKGFNEVIRTKGKQYTLTKLHPSTLYTFRLSAVNECGPSIYSDVMSFTTAVNLPSTPKQPQLLASTSNYLRLAWERRQTDETFCLQMNDHSSGHGYLTAYNGPETIYECSNLKRATVYHFKLKAENEAGSSPWSNEVAYKTQPDRPGRPSKPQVKGKIHGNYFKAKWDPPNDKGGAEIKRYFLEINSGAKFQQIYNGSEPETVCDRLSPGTTYQIRVCCEGPGGISNYSDICTVTTEAIQPGAPEPPYCDNVPGPFAAVLRWNPPDYNGGAPILEYEIKLTGLPNFCDEIIYRGKDMYCVCKDLRPGESYEANVRAVNRIGAGSWSDALKFKSGAAPPNQPDVPEISIRSPTHLCLTWKEPSSNGAPIIEYHLESALTSEANTKSFAVCYQGLQTSADIRNLIPYTLYYFRLNAANLAGQSLYSQIVSQKTPAAVPTAPEITKSEITATEVTLTWSEAESNGSDILYYQIEFVVVNSSSNNIINNNINSSSNINNSSNNNNNNITSSNANINNNNNNNNSIKNGNSGSSDSAIERFISTGDKCTEFTVANLLPETTYKFKIQAVNDIGNGQWSTPLKLTTLPPPPEPPKLECTGVGHNFIKLKWGEGRNLDFVNYYVEMYNSRLKDFQIVHSGTTLMCKVSKLQEQTEYTFRICAETDRAGTGDYSDEYVFKTSATLPSSIKAPRIAADTVPTELRTGAAGASASAAATNMLLGGNAAQMGVFHPLTIEWQHSKNSFVDPVEYILQCSTNGKENDFVEIHRGPDTRYTIDYLDPGSVYLFRVAPVRVTPTGDVQGLFTYPLRYKVPHKLTQDQLDSIHHHSNLIHRTSAGGSSTSNSLQQYAGYNYTSSSSSSTKSNSNGGLFSGLLSSVSGGHNNSATTATTNTNDGNPLLHPTNSNNVFTHGNNGGTNSDLMHINHNINNNNNNNDELLYGLNIFGAIRRFIHKCYTLYTNHKHFSDTQQAIFMMFSFLLITFIFAYLLRMFMR